MVLEKLVYDRTNETPGTISTDMLNRLESWCQYLADYLNQYGYAVQYEPYAIEDTEVEIREHEVTTAFAFTGSEQIFTVPMSGICKFTATGAAGSGGNAYSGYATTGGKGAKLEASFALSAGDVLRLIVGGRGTCTQATAKDGTSGGGGGCTMVLREIPAITDSRYQFTKDGKPFEVLLCVAGGGGGNDGSYQSSAKNGADGEAIAYRSPSNYTAASTTTSTGSTSSVMGIQQYIANNGAGGSYIRSSGKAQGGYGCGGATDDNPAYGGGWCSGSASYSANSWSWDVNAVGTDGVNDGDGQVIITHAEIGPVETPIVRSWWQMNDLPYRREMDRIRRNVDALQDGFYSLPDWREIIYNNTLDFNQANALEWDLQRIYDWLEAAVNAMELTQANSLFMQSGVML